MIYVAIPPTWLKDASSLQGEFSEAKIKELNASGYNIFYYPNYPKLVASPSQFIKGYEIDTFEYVFVDLDMKHGAYDSKDTFIEKLSDVPLPPTRIVDSGGGIHAYWRVSDLDAMTYLKFQRRLARLLNTDEAVSNIKQLMRVPGTDNTKLEGNPRPCELLYETDTVYTSEQLDKVLPRLSYEDEAYCKNHYNKTYNNEVKESSIDAKMPLKFAKLVASNPEVKEIWSGNVSDRSKSDYRLAHIMFAQGFSKEEATSVLVNAPKALSRAPQHRLSYATNIVDQIWTFEITEDKAALNLSSSVKDILNKAGDAIKGTRLPCYTYLDGTLHGFRLGQVIGLVAGSGVGKTAVALNMFMGFVANNPDLHHFFVPLEQPANEIADRWKTMCGDQEHLYEKVHVISNYEDNGSYRNLSLDQIREYLVHFQKTTGCKVGAVVIDHIGALKKKTKDGENQGLMDLCHSMKAFAIETNTLLVMQSQAPREKAGIGDLILEKDAAYGTLFFEAYCDYLITMHQPLKRCYPEGAPTVTSFKFCKIRHKHQGKDTIREDVNYKMFFDVDTGMLRPLTQDEEKSFSFFYQKCVNMRKLDKKSDVMVYHDPKKALETTDNGKTDNNQVQVGTATAKGLHQDPRVPGVRH